MELKDNEREYPIPHNTLVTITWNDVNEDLPQIQKDHWNTLEPVLVKLKNGSVTFAYFEKVEDKEDGRYFGTKFSPKFVCEDRRSVYYDMILTDVIKWMYLPK